MKRIRFISTILALSIAIVPFTLGAPAQALPISNADTISSQLMSVMEQKSSDSSAKIPVQIQLRILSIMYLLRNKLWIYPIFRSRKLLMSNWMQVYLLQKIILLMQM